MGSVSHYHGCTEFKATPMLQDPRPIQNTATNPSDLWAQAQRVLKQTLTGAGQIHLDSLWAHAQQAACEDSNQKAGIESVSLATCNYLQQTQIDHEVHRGVRANEIKHLPETSIFIDHQGVFSLHEADKHEFWPIVIAIHISQSTPIVQSKPPEDLKTFWRKLQQSEWLKSAFNMGKGGLGPVVQASFLINALALAAPLFSLQVYDRVIPNQAYSSLFALMLGVLLCLGFETMLKHARHRLMEHTATTIDTQCTMQLSKALLSVPTNHTEPSVLLQHLRSFEHLRDLITGVFLLALIDLPFLVLFVLVIALIHPAFLLITGAVLGLTMWRVMAAHRELAMHGHTQMGHHREAQSRWLDTLANLEMVQAMGVQSRFAQQLDKIQLQARLHGNALREKLFGVSHSTQTLQQFSWVMTLALGVYLVINQQITMGGMIAVSMLTMRCFAPLQKLQGHMLQLHTAQAGFDELDRFLNQNQSNHAKQNLALAQIDHIELQDVCVPKPKHNRSTGSSEKDLLLDDITCSIRQGDRLGVIGATGSGKTSFLRLLAKQISAERGQHTVNGLSTAHYHPAEFAAQVGLALQPPLLLKGTLLDNLQFRRPHISIEDCWASLEAMGLASWVREHPDGIYMTIEHQGANLSSGQKQAVSLCRAFAGTPSLLLLDEPTVCLDQALEIKLMDTLAKLPPQVIVVFTTHKLSMLSAAKTLMLLHKAKIHHWGDKPTVLHAAKALDSKVRETS